MFDVFGPVKGLIKLDEVCIDNNVFRLHYKATFIVLVVCSLLVTSKQYIGDPIDCIVEEIPNTVMVSTFLYRERSNYRERDLDPPFRCDPKK